MRRVRRFINSILKILASNDIAEVNQLAGVSITDIAYDEGETVSAGLWLLACVIQFSFCLVRKESIY